LALGLYMEQKIADQSLGAERIGPAHVDRAGPVRQKAKHHGRIARFSIGRCKESCWVSILPHKIAECWTLTLRPALFKKLSRKNYISMGERVYYACARGGMND